MERISIIQLFVLTTFFQIGTTIIFGFGNAAGRDAWIVTIISTCLGLLVIGLYLTLMYYNPGLTLVEWFQSQLGNWIGTPIAWLYPMLSLYEMGRGLNDIKFLTTTLIMDETPELAIIITFILILTYSQKCGLEVLARVAEFIFPIFLIIFFIMILLIIGSDLLELKQLQPVLENGWAPIWKVSFPLCASQGFAQTLELAMIWPLVNSSNRNIVKATIWATVFSGTIILITQLMLITGLNSFSYSYGNYPMFTLISKIELADFIQHLDVIGILFFIISTFMKVSLHMLFSIRAIQLLTKTKSDRKITIFVSILAVYLGHSVSLNNQQHIQVAFDIFPYNLWLPLLWVLPFLLLLVTLIKNAVMKAKNS